MDGKYPAAYVAYKWNSTDDTESVYSQSEVILGNNDLDNNLPSADVADATIPVWNFNVNNISMGSHNLFNSNNNGET